MAKKNQLVLALFENEEAADAAVSEIKKWDKATKDIKLGSIAVLVKDDKGKVKTSKEGARHTGTGVVAGVLAALLSGGVTLVGGVVVGAVTGSMIHKGLGLSKDDLAGIGAELDGGKAAVCILAADEETDAVASKLTELGGSAAAYDITEEAVADATATAEAAPADEEAVEDAPAEDAPAE